MLHLEEYLDTLEALPMELQRQFTLMRELDALSQDIQEQMKQKTETFVANPPTKDDPQHAESLHTFLQLFSTVLKHGEEKVVLATQTYDLVDKHIRKLDDDLAKFEERQLAMPARLPHAWGESPVIGGGNNNGEEGEEAVRGKRKEDARKRRGARAESPHGSTKSSTPGRRTGRGSSHAANNATRVAASESVSRARVASKVSVPDFSEMPIDPNEPRYCYCQQVSYGEMVACDDENCEVEWFHLGCVDLRAPPEGQWFCRDCSQKHKRRRGHS